MVLQVYILLEFFALALAACPQVPSAGLLPSEAVQDCGTSTADLDLCPFNCTLAWSHAGRLQCQNDTWQADDPNDLPRCIAPCLAETLANGYGERADVLGYLPGFWASPETPPTTTTTGMPCDTVGAQSCLQTVVAITDIQEFCARLPTAVECLKVAGCCQQAQGTIVGSIDSCATSGYTVEDPCTNDMEAQCRVTCAPGLVGAEANNASCTSLKRTPFCMRSQSCCPYWSTLGLDTLASNCTALGYDISDACGASNSFLVANEGAEVRVTCQSPRYANGSSHEDYLCQNSSFELTPPSQSKLQCVDPPCALARNANGTYQCFSDGQLLSLADAAVMQVPFGTSCTLQCSKSFEVPTPPMELHCAYVESDSSDIIYRDPLMVTSTGVPRMVERLADGSLRPAVPQVCEIMTCPLPSVQGLPAVVAGNMPQANASGEILYIECDGLSQFARCSPVCAYGYEVDSLRYLLCDTGTFQGEVRCVKQRCAGSAPWPFGTSGSLSSCTDGLHGQFCEVLCAAGYTRDSNLASYQCEAGQWMVPTTPPCIESSCFAAPVLENAQRLQACANRPAGYECNVTCLSGYQPVGSLRCVQGAYELSGLGCVASAVATRTAQVAAAQVVLVSVSEAEANTTRGRVERSARGLLGLDATVTPAQLATLVAEEVPSISPLDRALALAALQQLSPEAALRAALRTLLTAAIIPEVEAIFPVVEVALTRLDAHGVWANASEVLVQSSPSNLDQWLTATLQRLLGASLSATALQALAQDGSADAVDRTSLELQRVFSASLARSMTTAAALSATALVHYEMGESLPQTEMDALHLALVSRFGQLLESSAGTSVPSEFDAQWAAAIQRFNLQDHASSVAALGALASRVTSLGGSMELVAALAMQGFWQLRTVCADTLLRCQRQEERRWIEAGRASAQLAKWRPGGFLNAAEIAAAVPRVSGGGAYLLAGALSTFGVEEQDLTLLMPGAADARKAFALSQVTSIEALQRLPTYTAVGFNLGVLLGYDLGVMTPLEGELAMEWAGDQVAGATFRARLAGASNAELTTAYLSAAQVPLSSRTPTAVAANVASALPLQTEESRRCTITRAVASALGLPAKQAAQAAAISSGFDAASYSSSLTQLSSFADPSLFAAAVQQHLGAKAAEMSDFQTLSFGFAVAMESFQGYAMPLQVALFMLDPTRRSVSQLATLALCTGAGLSDLAIALVAGMPNTGDLRTTALLLGQAMTGMKEVPSSPIARTALRHAVVALAAQREPKGDHEQLLSAGLRYSITPWASLIARRAAESLQAEGGDLAAKVNSEVAASSSGAAQAADIVERSAAAHLAAVHAGLDGSECARTVLAVLDTEAALGAFLVPLWAQKWPPRAADVITSSATASVAVLEHFSQGSLEPCLGHAVNSTACSPQPASGCALQTGLSLGFTCESFCSSWSTVSWPKQCLGFRRSCTTELLGCNYAVTSQDLTQSSSGVCVCSDARQSVNGATENAQRLARLSMELQTLEFLAPVASTGMPPTEVQLLASEALRQAANVSRPNIVATTVAVGGRVTPALTPTQVAYVAFSLALQQGFARSEAAMAALEVSSLDEDNNLAPLADVMILSGLDVPEARALVVATAMRQLRKSPQALRQAFWRLQMLDDGARQLRRSTILGTFEGSSAYMIYLTDKEAFQSTATAARSAMAAGAQASEMLQYLMASGYSFDQAIQMLNVQADQAMQTTGATLAQRFTFPIYTPLAAAWWSEGSSTSTLPVVPLQQAHEQVILQALAQHFVLDPAQILFLTRPGSARRLQTVSLAKCSLDFVVEVLPSNDANSLEQRLGRFGSAWSFDSFRQRLATAMNESGLVLPSCFSGDPTVAVQHVQVINDFALASSEWLASEWGACPGLCGEAVHSRGVECSTGNEYACKVSGNKPPTTQRCEIYVDCPFDWNCPFGGPGADLACPVQLFLFVTGVVIVSILLLCILRLVVRHFCCQRPKGGELALYGKHGQQMKVNFYIVEQKGEQEDLNVMKMLSLQSKEAEDPSKLHVVWDVDVEKAQKMEIEKWKMKKIGGGITSEQQQRALQRLPGNANNGRKYARQSTGEMLRMSEQEAKVEWALSQKSHKTSSSRRSSPSRRVSRDASPSKSPRSKSSSGGDQEKDQPYPLNARVEYFSSNNCRWLPATIGSSYTEDGYDIHLTGVRGYGAQTRAKVELHQLRAPILEGEFVSVFSTKEEIWHHGTVLSKALPSVAVVGFTIKILHEDEEMILHNVPLHHVWRRFPEGMPVQVYQDEIGWMNAQVLRDAEMIEPLPEKDAMPSWYTVEVAYDHGETEEVPGYRVQRQVMSL